MPEAQHVIGWDVGGAHLKACWLSGGQVLDVAQWVCPLWQGIDHLERALGLAAVRWPVVSQAMHAVTMTGEMTDLFEHREDGVQRIAALLAAQFPAQSLRFYCGAAGWCALDGVRESWPHIASANWLATAHHAAQHVKEGVLVDIGSTTTDLIAFRDGRVLGRSRSDAQRLATGELVYQGVVRTPLCALAARIAWRGQSLNVMNEFFATTADIYRLTGELDASHDLYPTADNAPKNLPATRRRLARMIGLDAREASDAEWLNFARSWREQQVLEIGAQLQRVMRAHGLSDAAVAISAGCGDFLLPDLVPPGMAVYSYGLDIARSSTPAVAAWAQVCAPSVAVAALLDGEPVNTRPRSLRSLPPEEACTPYGRPGGH